MAQMVSLVQIQMDHGWFFGWRMARVSWPSQLENFTYIGPFFG